MAEQSIILKVTNNTSGFYYVNTGAAVDNVFTFTDADGRVVSIIDSKAPYLLRLGGILPGSNMLSRVQTILNSASVKEIIFDYGDITLTGTLNCQGKKLIFKNNSKIIGTNTLNNGILDCDLKAQCLTITTTLTNFKSVRAEFSCENFGAVGASGDETAILQKTSDTLISNNNMPKTIRMFPNKVYGTYGWVWHNWGAGDYNQFSLSLIGENSAMGGNPGYAPAISCLNHNGFGIGLQRATGFTIKGIEIVSSIVIPPAAGGLLSEYYSRPYSTFSSSVGARDSQFSPMASIVIDPFRNDNSLPPDGGYPDYNGTITANNPSGTNWYRGTGIGIHAGSTAGVIDDVVLSGATVGIMTTPNGNSQQCENMTWGNIFAYSLKAVFGWGQSESKNNYIYSGYSIGVVHTVFDGYTWGGGSAGKTMAHIKGWCSAGGIEIIRGGTQHELTIENIYTEELYTIGSIDAGAGRVEFRGCTFSFANTQRALTMPLKHFVGSNVDFKTCQLRYYDDLFDKRVIIEGNAVNFKNCYFDLPPIGYNTSYSGSQSMINIDIENCFYEIQKKFGWNTLKGNLNSENGGHLPHGVITKERGYAPLDGAGSSSIIFQRFDCGHYDTLSSFFSTISFNINASTRTATFTNPGLPIIIGNYIFTDLNDGLNATLLGRVSSINYTTNLVNLVDVPLLRLNGIQANIGPVSISDYKRFKGRFTGTYTYGTNTVTNIFGDPIVGEIDLCSGNIITAYDSVTKIITLYGNVTSGSGAPIELYSPSISFGGEKITYTRLSPPTDNSYYTGDTTKFFPGDEWISIPTLSYLFTVKQQSVRKFKCITSGYLFPGSIGQTKQSLWVEIFDGDFKQTASGIVDFSVVIPKDRFIKGWRLIATIAGMTVTTGSTNLGVDIDPGTILVPGVSQIINYNFYPDADTTLYFNGITGSGGTLTVNFF